MELIRAHPPPAALEVPGVMEAAEALKKALQEHEEQPATKKARAEKKADDMDTEQKTGEELLERLLKDVLGLLAQVQKKRTPLLP